MKYFIDQNSVELDDSNFKAKGGQGSVYFIKDTAYKIYENPINMLPVKKIAELSVLKNPYIIKPEKLIKDSNQHVVGYTMKYISDGSPLCVLFTRAYREKNKVSEKAVVALAKKLYDLVDFTHSQKIIIVDLNELNFLVDKKYKNIFAIDTDNYQTPSFPSVAIMDNIRDRHCNNKFNSGTDWFAWGILTCQLIVGVHPYRGGHPDFDKLKPAERMNERMKANISIFNPKSHIANHLYPIDNIPAALKKWMIGVFEKGDRTNPPKDFDNIVVVASVVRKVIANSNEFKIDHYYDFKKDVIKYYQSASKTAFIVGDQNGNRILFNNNQDLGEFPEDGVMVFTPKMETPLAISIVNGKLKIQDVLNHKDVNFDLNAEHLLECEGRCYVINGKNVVLMNFMDTGGNILPSCKIAGSVLNTPGTTQVFDGMILQNMLGKYVATIYPDANKSLQTFLPELDGYKVIDAKYERGVFVFVAIRKGVYDRFVFRLDVNYLNGQSFEGQMPYDVRKTEDITPSGINFVVNDKRICILINEDGNVELFVAKKDGGGTKEVVDKAISGDMYLGRLNGSIVFHQGSHVYNFSKK